MTTTRPDGFEVVVSEHSLGFNLPQRLGRLLWAPMLVMALMAFPIGLAIGAARASLIDGGGDGGQVAALGHLGPAVMFLGFASAFAAIAFAIARILGALRDGGGRVQAAAGREVQSLPMLPTAKAFIALMAAGMMLIVAAVIAHVVVALGILGGSTGLLATSAAWADGLEAVRRLGVATYLVSIALGLATIFEVLRFQAIRIRELPASRSGARDAGAV